MHTPPGPAGLGPLAAAGHRRAFFRGGGSTPQLGQADPLASALGPHGLGLLPDPLEDLQKLLHGGPIPLNHQ